MPTIVVSVGTSTGKDGIKRDERLALVAAVAIDRLNDQKTLAAEGFIFHA
jgi:hypothetical protein